MRAPPLLRQLATGRLLDPAPAAVKRLERTLVAAINAAEWERAKRLLVLRRELSPKVRDTAESLEVFASLAELLDWAQAKGFDRHTATRPPPPTPKP